MSKTELMNSITRAIGKASLELKKHSPEILIGVGIITGVAGAVMACKATLKVNEVLDEAKENIDKIHEAKEAGHTLAGEVYTEEDSKKEMTIVYAKTGFKLVRLYGPAVTLGVVSIGCVLASNNIIRQRNIALAAAYATVDNSFKDYRKRVIDRFGKELDRELKYNIRTEEIEEKVVDENGEEKTVKKTIEVIDEKTLSEYDKFFDEYSTCWKKDAEANKFFLIQTQNYANEKLQQQGHMFLNEVYDMLDIPRTKIGQEVGWVYDPHNPDIENYIDFGIFDIHREGARDFVNGRERSILLHFNVQGSLMHLMQ